MLRAIRSGGLIAVSALAVAAGSVAAQRAEAPTSLPPIGSPPTPDVRTALRDMQDGATTSEAITRRGIAIMLQRDQTRATLSVPLRSVLALNPDADDEAVALDRERAAGRLRGPLHGVPILIKDNIETRELPTTAGSLALAENRTERDAPIVTRLRAAGAIILGKTNLSEWANIRSTRSTSGWSATGGLTRNPYVLDRNTCGSSSGSAVAVAAGLAPAAIGTETDGSITCPAAANGIVGYHPTVGLLSRSRIVPISRSQDTAGPMTRTVADAAALLTVMAGSDPADPATAEADARRADYAAALRPDALRGRRVGVLRYAAAAAHPQVQAAFDRAVADLRAAGAEPVEITAAPQGLETIGRDELTVLLTEFRADLNAYLATTPAAVRTRTLADVIAFNREHAEQEMPLFGQELFEEAEQTRGLQDPAYLQALQNSRGAATRALETLMSANRVDVLVAPTLSGPMWVTDLLNGDNFSGSISTLPAVAGWPHLTVPMGQVGGLPVGLSFIGPRWADAQVLAYGYAYEQQSRRFQPPQFLPTVEAQPAVAEHTRPARAD